VDGKGRTYYLLSVVDVYSRKIPDWLFAGSIRRDDLIGLLKGINCIQELKGVVVGTDNGSQFMAHRVRNFLKDAQVKQEFTHIATLEENAYIEAFPSILEREVI
jgi:transposase InsO family protein